MKMMRLKVRYAQDRGQRFDLLLCPIHVVAIETMITGGNEEESKVTVTSGDKYNVLGNVDKINMIWGKALEENEK